MLLYIRCSILFLVVFFFQTAHAQLEHINVYDATGDSLFSIEDCRHQTVVVVFDKFDCPYVQEYEYRLLKLQEEFKDQVLFVYVNSDAESLNSRDFKKRLLQRIAALPENTPYLLDKYANYYYQLGVLKSPEVCVIHKKKLVYKGGVDDNPLSKEDVRDSYLKEVLSAIRTNKKPERSSARVAGCMIARD